MNRRSKLNVLLASTLLLLGLTDTARAELITVRFAGTVTTVRVSTRPQIQGFDFPDVGDLFTGFYIYDSSALDTSNSSEQGSFRTRLPDVAIGVTIGGLQFAGQASSIVTFQDYYGVGDHIPSIEIMSNSELAEVLNVNNFSLSVARDGLFTDPNLLPLFPPSLVGAQSGLSMTLDNHGNTAPGNYVDIFASLDSLSIVPEPYSFLLVSLGILLFLPGRNWFLERAGKG